ncbi:hypothetical protein [Paraburkholderia sp. Tr-20389]|uniref:hypothetical protein n=1 Tax=Paraburkholderia sp. Tr-20389 TaxID=2703903 RepID=UPI001F11F660|nr:hypothetical protein [Paraburkholderia sp. Tr-20389]
MLARVPTMCCSSSDLQSHREAADLAYEKVVAAVQALKDDVHRSFSQGGVLSDSAVAGASGFARALAEIMSTDEDVGAYERAVTAILKVRFAVRYPLVDDVADAHDTEQDQDVNVHSGVPPLSTAANGWMQRVKDVVHHPASLHK